MLCSLAESVQTAGSWGTGPHRPGNLRLCFENALAMVQKKTDGSRPWASLPDKSEGLVDAMFQVSVSVEIGNGQRALFWLDRWLQGKSISELAPCLFNAVGPRVVKHRTVEEGLLNNTNWARDIPGALTVQ